MKILVVRNDRLGDALLALPAVLALRLGLPESNISFLCRESVAPAVRGWCLENRVDVLTSWVPGQLRNTYDSILFLHSDEELLVEAWREWVKTRIGVYSRPLSFLTLNGGLLQRRSRSLQNEALYNLDLANYLLRKLGKKEKVIVEKILLPINQWENAKILERIRGSLKAERFVVVHPGMGGSALNISVDAYQRVIHDLDRAGNAVVLSQGPSPIDAEMVMELKKRMPSICVFDDLALAETMELFRQASLVIGPSTGPLHLAHFVGTPTLGIFSPIKSHNLRRWSPWGGTGKTNVWSPQVKCEAKVKCLGSACSNFSCMENFKLGELNMSEIFA